MAIDVSTVVAGFIMAAGNVGAAGLLVNRTLNKQDSTEKTVNEHTALLAAAAESQKATAETLERVQESITELYGSRNALEKAQNAVDVLHDVKGCKTFFQGGKG